jgi:biotin carboxylase
MKRKILIMGANPETTSLVIKAKEMNLITYVTDYNSDAYAKQLADVPVDIDASHVDELVEFVKKEKIDAVLVGVAEALMPFYFEVCKRLGYPCFATLEQFEIMVSKDKFKTLCRKYDVPVVPEFSKTNLDTVNYPVVVKPVDSCSSKGISVCFNREELDLGINKALGFSRSGEMLIEKYMNGDEVVIYYIIQNSEPFLVGMCDRYTNKEQKGVAQLPTSYIFPSRYLSQFIEESNNKVCNMLKKMGLTNGVLFLQAFVDDCGTVRIYEPGFRLNGAQEHLIIGNVTGVDAKELLLNFALTGSMGEPVKSKADPFLHGKYGCKLSPLVKTGKIGKIKGLSEIKRIKSVVSINPSYRVGETVDGYGTLKQIICRFFIVSDTKEELVETIEKIYSLLEIEDESGDSMLLTPFDTSLVMKNYK